MKNNTVFTVKIPVRPSIEHPQYWHWECGHLWVWLYAETMPEAAAKAVAFAELMPYEIIRNEKGCALTTTPGGAKEPGLDFANSVEKFVEWFGVAFYIIYCETGADVAAFEKMYLPPL